MMHPLFKIAPILLLAACQTSSTGEKTGYVNTAHVVEKMKMKQAFDTKLADMKSKKQPEINYISNELESVKAEIANSKIQEADYMNELKEKRNHLYWRLEVAMKAIQDSTASYDKQVVQEMDKQILAFGKEHEYTFIFPLSTTLYADSAMNITHEVIEFINK
ncbi:MAG: OmpH family outer membrane protein [Bacteroidetes bacterium]|nr:OmpH family outer membrane protein [Bacteroidota bacterium]